MIRDLLSCFNQNFLNENNSEKNYEQRDISPHLR